MADLKKFEELVAKLKEIFQLDKPELDFGIYRILHARQAEINDFLETRLKEKVEEALAGSDDALAAETDVYSNLLKFFSRYYEEGDFISQRRYNGDKYAIPYAGEEVKLHWANADQYYIKSGENFTNYDFTLENGRKVHFKLVSAATAKDNVKDADARCFVLWDPARAKDAPPNAARRTNAFQRCVRASARIFGIILHIASKRWSERGFYRLWQRT